MSPRPCSRLPQPPRPGGRPSVGAHTLTRTHPLAPCVSLKAASGVRTAPLWSVLTVNWKDCEHVRAHCTREPPRHNFATSRTQGTHFADVRDGKCQGLAATTQKVVQRSGRAPGLSPGGPRAWPTAGVSPEAVTAAAGAKGTHWAAGDRPPSPPLPPLQGRRPPFCQHCSPAALHTCTGCSRLPGAAPVPASGLSEHSRQEHRGASSQHCGSPAGTATVAVTGPCRLQELFALLRLFLSL